MPLPAGYVGTGIAAPIKIMGPRGDGFIADTGTIYTIRPSFVISQTFTNPSTIDTDGIVTSHAGAGSAGTTTKTPNGALASGGIATLTPARNVVITVTHATSVVAMSGTITGTRLGRAVTEAWSVTATGTTKTFTGKKAFDKVTSITEVVAADASANTIVMGDGKVLGLNFKASSVYVIAEEEGGAIPTLGVIVKGSSEATADARGTYTPNSTLNGALDFQIWYLSDDLTTLYP